MNRRNFIISAIGTAATITAGLSRRILAQEQPAARGKFKLKYAPHFSMFENHAGGDLIDQLKFAADEGFSAFEDNGMMGQPAEMQEKIGKEMARLGLTMGVFVAYSGFGSPKMVTDTSKDFQNSLRNQMKQAIEVAKKVNAKWCTVVPASVTQNLEMDYQTANLIENLKAMAEVCEPTGLVMVLEPLNWWANHPGLFLTKVPQTYQICKAVNSPSCKILDDLYHQQVSEGNLIPNIDKAWDHIGYIQVGDNPGRNEPTTGEINYKNIFRHLYNKGYKGLIGMEHGNSKGGKEGERAVINAYRQCDDF